MRKHVMTQNAFYFCLCSQLYPTDLELGASLAPCDARIDLYDVITSSVARDISLRSKLGAVGCHLENFYGLAVLC